MLRRRRFGIFKENLEKIEVTECAYVLYGNTILNQSASVPKLSEFQS